MNQMDSSLPPFTSAQASGPEVHRPESVGGLDVLLTLAQNLRVIVLGPILVGGLAIAATFVVRPTFTATTVILPPQQQSSLASSALSSMGALAGLAGAAGGLRSPLDQQVSLLQSVTIADRIIARFKLGEVYELGLQSQVRRELAGNVRVSAGRRDGLITIEVDDHDPRRVADLANAFVEELRRLNSTLAITEAQQRKVFFEGHLAQTTKNLAAAQAALQSSGFGRNSLKVEPKVAVESYAKLKAELTHAEIKLQSMHSTYAASSAEVIQQSTVVAALRGQLGKMEQQTDSTNDADYIGKYREFKYQETLFELFSRQFEMARVDESREGGLLQVVDVATVPDRKSKPKRLMIAVSAAVASFVLLLSFVLIRAQFRHSLAVNPASGSRMAQLRSALRGEKRALV